MILQGKAYKVSQAEVPEDEPGTTNYVFKPASTDDVLSDKAAHLEVIRQVSALLCSCGMHVAKCGVSSTCCSCTCAASQSKAHCHNVCTSNWLNATLILTTQPLTVQLGTALEKLRGLLSKSM